MTRTLRKGYTFTTDDGATYHTTTHLTPGSIVTIDNAQLIVVSVTPIQGNRHERRRQGKR